MNKTDIALLVITVITTAVSCLAFGWVLRDNQMSESWDFNNEPPNSSEPARVVKLEIYKRDIVFIDDTDKTLSFVIKGGVLYERIHDTFLTPQENEVVAQGKITIDFGEWQSDN